MLAGQWSGNKNDLDNRYSQFARIDRSFTVLIYGLVNLENLNGQCGECIIDRCIRALYGNLQLPWIKEASGNINDDMGGGNCKTLPVCN